MVLISYVLTSYTQVRDSMKDTVKNQRKLFSRIYIIAVSEYVSLTNCSYLNSTQVKLRDLIQTTSIFVTFSNILL